MRHEPEILADLPVHARRRLAGEPVMVVNLAAIRRNFRALAQMAKGTCAAVVKGDAYGHGMLAAAHVLHKAGGTLFFTARFEDALELRNALGPGPRIAALDGVTAGCMADAVAHAIIPVVNSREQLETAFDASRRQAEPLAAFIHLDTAMNRLGLAPEDDALALPMLKQLSIQAYMTHFASADDVDIGLCKRQVERLRERSLMLPKAPLSIANSCGVFLGEEFHGQIVRPGKSTFGINPLADGPNPLQEPATVLAPVVQTRTLRKGDPVGYSSTWHAPAARRVAILAIGYANGYLRANSNVAHVAFGKRIAPVIGRISMDLTAVDVWICPRTRFKSDPSLKLLERQ